MLPSSCSPCDATPRATVILARGYNSRREPAPNHDTSVSIEKTSDTIAPSPAATRPPEFYTLRLDPAYLRLRYWSTWLLLALLRGCAPLPLRASRAVGALLGWSFFLVNGKRLDNKRPEGFKEAIDKALNASGR